MSTTPDAVPARDAATAPHDARPVRASGADAPPVPHADAGPAAAGAPASAAAGAPTAAAVGEPDGESVFAGRSTSPTDPLGPLARQPRSSEPAPAHPVTPARRRRLLQLVAALAVAVLVVDQLTKVWAVRALTPGERTAVVGDLLGLSLIYNPGAALSIATGLTWVLTLIAVVVVAVTVRASRRIGSRGWAVALGLLLGGAVGNLLDRFFREPGPARGHVVDFIAYGRLFVGNVADIAIVGAAGLIVVLSVRGIGLDGSREPDGRGPAQEAGADPDPEAAAAPQDSPRG